MSKKQENTQYGEEKSQYSFNGGFWYPTPPVKPYLCPVCNGCGTVQASFYADLRGTSAEAGEVPCRTCYGRGVLWG